ncbi:helix-turn-helix domain containing protein [Phenylobacterium sp. LjRoot225]|uniref:TetR/AcrR family transcriptional regulator n=1 Tax=Phenylobacterium sp. LjRoot225 TaxID=3342285 RepID=UPI003ECCD0FD
MTVKAKRVRRDPEDAKNLILDATEGLMLDEGYAAVTTRSVAKRAGLAPGLVHYYFPSTDDLLVAAYRRATAANFEQLTSALEADDPVKELWRLQTEGTPMALAVEFMALGNHRKAIRAEIAAYGDRARDLQSAAVARFIQDSPVDPAICPSICFATLLASVARGLVMEQSVGISRGHAETRVFMQWMLEWVSGSRKATPAS